MNTQIKRKRSWIKTSTAELVSSFKQCISSKDANIIELKKHQEPIMNEIALQRLERHNFLFPSERTAINSLIQINSHRKQLCLV